MTKGIFDKKDYYGLIKILIILLIIYIFVISGGRINMLQNWNNILIEISLGLLTFLAIFYTFVIRKEIIKKRDLMLRSRWRNYLPEIQEYLSILKKESVKSSKPDYKIMLDTSENISEKINDITLFETETDIRKHLLVAVFAFIVTTLIFFIDSVTNWKGITFDNSLFTLRFFGYILFWAGIYRTITLLLTWNRIVVSK